MVEYQRGNGIQWVDSTRCMIVDTVTGELQRFGKGRNAVGTQEEALLTLKSWSSTRYLIIQLKCIEGFQLSSVSGSKT